MTAEEIRATKNESDDGTWETSRWLQELAAQVAEANAAQRERAEKIDAQIAEAKAKGDKKSEVFDALLSELMPLIPKVREMFEANFAPPDALASSGFASGPPDFIAPAAFAKPDDGALLEYLQSRGHDEAKAKQIIANHRSAVLDEMFHAGIAIPRASMEVPGGQENGEEEETETQGSPETAQPGS